MNQIIPFNYGDSLIRVVSNEETGEQLWVAKDICSVLGYSKNTSSVLSKLKESEKGIEIFDTLGGNQEMAVINEAGLYKLILRSNKPEAEPFSDWVTHEVLPTIRRTGSYSMHGAEQTPIDLSAIIPMIAESLVPIIVDAVSAKILPMIQDTHNSVQIMENRVQQTNQLITDAAREQITESFKINAALRENTKMLDQKGRSMISPMQLAELDTYIEQRSDYLARAGGVDIDKARISIMAQIKKHFNLQRWFLVRQDKYHHVYEFIGRAQLDWSFKPDEGGIIVVEDEED